MLQDTAAPGLPLPPSPPSGPAGGTTSSLILILGVQDQLLQSGLVQEWQVREGGATPR